MMKCWVQRSVFVSLKSVWLYLLLGLSIQASGQNAGQTPTGEHDSDQALVGAYQMPVWVDAVRRVCPWKSADAEGDIRLIRKLNDDGSHGLFVQWLRKGLAGAPTEAVSTLAIEELSTDYLVRIEMPEPQLSRDACLLKAIAEDMMNERRYEFGLILKGPGDMQVQVTRMLGGGV